MLLLSIFSLSYFPVTAQNGHLSEKEDIERILVYLGGECSFSVRAQIRP